MKKFKLAKAVGLLLVLYSQLAVGQVNRAMMDDAMALADFLKKDYRSIPSKADRKESLAADLERAVAIVHAYANTWVPITPDYLDKINNCVLELEQVRATVQKADMIKGVKIDTDTYKKLVADQTTARQTLSENRINGLLEQLSKLESGGDGLFKVLARLMQVKIRLVSIDEKYPDVLTGAIQPLSVSKSTPLLGAGGVSFSVVIDALSTYLAERLKEELALEIAIQMKKALASDDTPYPELRTLLPGTASFLANIQATSVPVLLENLKQHIKTDLNQLLDNGPKLLTLKKYQPWVERNPELAFAFDGIRLIKSLSQVSHPMELVPMLENSFLFTKTWANPEVQTRVDQLRNLVQVMALVNNGLKVSVNGTGMAWVNITNLQPYLKDPAFAVVWMSLFVQAGIKTYPNNDVIRFLKMEDISLQKAIVSNDQYPSNPLYFLQEKEHVVITKLNASQAPLQAIIYQAGALNDKVVEMQKAKRADGKVGYSQIYDFTMATIDMVDTLLSATNQLTAAFGIETRLGQHTPILQRHLALGRKGVEVYKNLAEKNYASAIASLVELVPGSANANLTVLTNLSNLAFLDHSSTLEKLNKLKDTGFLSKGDVLRSIATVKKMKDALPGTGEYKATRDSIDRILARLNATLLGVPLWEQANADQAKDLLDKYKKSLLRQDKANLDSCLKQLESLSAALRKSPILSSPDDVKALENLCNDFKTELSTYDENKPFKEALPKTFNNLNQLVSMGVITRTTTALLSQKQGLASEAALRYINFFGAAASATSKDELSAAFKNLFEPVGSWSKKRMNSCDLSLNAYVGASFGGECSKSDGNTIHKFTTGLSAPIGLSLKICGNDKPEKRIPGCLSLFVSVIDIGAVTWLRFEGDTTITLPKLTWANLVAPGLHLIYGLPGTGFSVAAFGQCGPMLRKVETGKTATTNFRYGFGLYYDLPLLRLVPFRSKQ